MPNWCYQHMTAYGNAEDTEKFLNAVKTKDSDGNDMVGLNHLFPCPQELRDTTAGFYTAEPNENWSKMLASGEITQEHYDGLVQRNADGYAKDMENLAKHGYKNWYDWQCDNYGTKWGACEMRIDDTFVNSNGVTVTSFYFESAWGPADRLIAKVSGMFPNMVFSMSATEESNAFAIAGVWHNGELVSEAEINSDFEVEGDMDDDDWYEKYCDKQNEIRDSLDGVENALVLKVLERVKI